MKRIMHERGSEEMEVKANIKEELTLFVKKVKFHRERKSLGVGEKIL
jgi:hypothetical protein